MMTAQRLAGLAERGEWDALLGAVITNGRPVPLPARVRMSEERGAGASALGLALCRAVELTYLPAPESRALAMLTLGSQLEDGSFGSIAGSACAAAGLRAYEDQLRTGVTTDADASFLERLAEASDLALRHLMSVVSEREPAEIDRADLAVVLWALSGRTRASEAWWVSELCGLAEALGLTHDASLSSIVAPALVRSGAGAASARTDGGMGVAA